MVNCLSLISAFMNDLLLVR